MGKSALMRKIANGPMKMLKVESPDINDRVEWIIEHINEGKRDPKVRQIASSILTKKENGDWAVKERDWENEIKAVYDYVRKNVRYTRDIENVELFQKARRTLELKIGDCDDLAIIAGSILQNIGYPLLIRVISMNADKVFQHVYLMVGVPPGEIKQYIPFDASREFGVGWELKDGVTAREDYEVFDVNDIEEEE